MIGANLAEVYDIATKRLNEQVKRNAERFPEDFMFRLTVGEKAELVAKCDHLARLKFAKALPFTFTEHGAIMAASVLNSPKAIEVSVTVVRAFVALRRAVCLPLRPVASTFSVVGKRSKAQRKQLQSQLRNSLRVVCEHLDSRQRRLVRQCYHTTGRV